jgi:ferredoxin
MNEEIRKHPLNAKGKYYVNQDDCTWCAACVDTAPNNFALIADKVELGAYVFKQPETPEEKAQSDEAVMCCPHEAIFDDGK